MTRALRPNGSVDVTELLTEHVMSVPTALTEVHPRSDGPPLRVAEVISTETPEQVLRRKLLAKIAATIPTPGPRWRSARSALNEWAKLEADKVTAKSTSAVLGREIDKACGSDGNNERSEPVRFDQRGAEWVMEVEQALAVAFVRPWVLSTYPARIELQPETCRAIMLASVVGKLIRPELTKRPDFDRSRGDKPGEDPTRGGAKGWKRRDGFEWVTQEDDVIVDEVKRTTQIAITVGDVRRVTAHGMRRVAEYLAGDEANPRGLVPRPRPLPVAQRNERGEVGLVQDACDLEGWKDISACLGVPERTARRWARKEVHPLPVVGGKGDGPVRASTQRLTRWVQEEFAGATPDSR